VYSFWRRQILFRNYLIANPLYLKEYQELKENNLRVTPEKDLQDLSLSEVYNSGKSEFVRKIIDLAEDITTTVRYFVALQLEGDISKIIQQIHLQYQEVLMPNLAEPHITVKAPTGFYTDYWVNKFVEILQSYKPFTVRFDQIGVFNNSVVYLEVKGCAEVVDIHNKLINCLGSSPELKAKYFEGSQYIPHTTLAHVKESSVLDEILPQIRDVVEPLMPMDFTIKNIVIYRQDGKGNPFYKYKVVSLN
jgi:2'-5' RNA ligase